MTAFTAPTIAVPHGFFGAEAGDCSLAKADPTALANRRRAAGLILPGVPLMAAYQIHSPDCVIVTEPWPDDQRPQADALVTDRPGHLLSIVTADCAPVLLADPAAGVVGAAHAGWKGAFTGVVENTVAAMEALGARRGNIAAAIGPCIAQASYEVDQGFAERFAAADRENLRFFAAGKPGHWQFDLEAYVASRLEMAGVARVEKLGLDTLAEPERFYSYRRATLRGEPAYGRQISLIGLA